MRTEQRRDGWILAAVAVALSWRELHWLIDGVFNEDELENLQVLWLFHHGLVFGRDYVSSHLPSFALLLEPLYRWRGPTVALPGTVRLAMVPLLAWTFVEIHALGRRAAGSARGGLVTLILVLASPTLAVSLSEARPDAVALPLGLAGLRLFAGYARDRDGGTATRLVLSGLAFGTSLLFNPKAIFVLLATGWAADRHHLHDRVLAPRARALRFGMFAGAALAPLALVLSLLLGARIIGWRDVEVFLTTGYRWLDPTPLIRYKHFLLERIVGLVPWPWLLGALALVRDRPTARAPRDPAWEALWLAALAHLGQVAFSAVLVTQMLLWPVALLAAATSRAIRDRSSATSVLVCLIAVIVPAVAAPEDRAGREDQLARLAFVLATVPEDRAVIDGRFGTEAFRPLVGRFQQFRPWIYRPGVYAREQARVIEAIASERVGAVIHHPLFGNLDPELRRLIERHYVPSARPDVWLPRHGPAMPEAHLPRAQPPG